MADVVTPEGSPHSARPPQTRQDDPESPAHGNLRASNKRRQRELNRAAAPIGEGTPSRHQAVADAVRQRIQADQKATRTRHNIIQNLAAAVDSCLDHYTDPAQLPIARELQGRVLKAIYASFDSPPASGSDAEPSTSPSHRSWADVAKTPKNPAPLQGGAAKTKAAPTAKPAPRPAARPPPTDNRILITLGPAARMQQASPFAARKAIVEAVGNGITLSDIPQAKATKTGWAITPRNEDVKAHLMNQEPRELMIRAVEGEDARLPERWVNYAVQGVDSHYRSILGSLIPTHPTEVYNEALSQTGVQPTSVRPSRHGPQEDGRITWIISFPTPVRAFRLFGQSDYSKEIRKNPPISLHNPGCQGYCKITNCTRAARCPRCGKPAATHEGPIEGCQDAPRCPNCHGPFEATHPNCPAAPSRVNGRIVRPTKRTLMTIRQSGQRATLAAAAAAANPSTGASEETPIDFTANDIPSPQTRSTAAASANKRGRPEGTAPRQELTSESEAPESSRPRRLAAPTQDLSLRRLSAKSVRPRDPEHTDPSSTEHADTEMSTDSHSC